MRPTQLAKSVQNDCQELADAGRDRDEVKLLGNESLFKTLVSGCHIESAAVIAGVSERTVYRRLADPEFRRQIAQARQSLRESILAKLTDAGHDAIGVLMDLMHSGEEEAVRLKAAKAVLDSLMNFQRFESDRFDSASNNDAEKSGNVVIYLPHDGRNLPEGLPLSQPQINLV